MSQRKDSDILKYVNAYVRMYVYVCVHQRRGAVILVSEDKEDVV